MPDATRSERSRGQRDAYSSTAATRNSLARSPMTFGATPEATRISRAISMSVLPAASMRGRPGSAMP